MLRVDNHATFLSIYRGSIPLLTWPRDRTDKYFAKILNLVSTETIFYDGLNRTPEDMLRCMAMFIDFCGPEWEEKAVAFLASSEGAMLMGGTQ